MANYTFNPNEHDIYMYSINGQNMPIFVYHINTDNTLSSSDTIQASPTSWTYNGLLPMWHSGSYSIGTTDYAEQTFLTSYDDDNINISGNTLSLKNESGSIIQGSSNPVHPTGFSKTSNIPYMSCIALHCVANNAGNIYTYNANQPIQYGSNLDTSNVSFTPISPNAYKGTKTGNTTFSLFTFAYNIGTENSKCLARMIGASTLFDNNNPYNGGDNPTTVGNGKFDYTGDEIPIPDLPSISVCDSGFVSLFAPNETQLKALSDFMWSDSFSLDSFKKLFNDPMDCILGLSIVPVNIPTGSAREITVGNVVSTVSCDVVTSQFVSVDCGSLTISPTQFSGSYLDYAPYVKAYLYLPFIGVQQLNIDDIMNSTLHIVYHVDILTGACVCYVQATNRKTGGVSQPDAVLYTYMGQCSEPVPLSSQSYSGALSAIMQTAGIAGVAIGTVATGGASAPAAAAALTGLAGSTARTATSMKPSVQHGGSLMGSSGFMCTLYPYMIFDCPHTAIPTKQYVYTGFPSNKIVKLSSLSGFNVVQAVNLTVDGATGTEMEEIKNYLESGVII